MLDSTIKAGTTSKIVEVTMYDSTTGEGKTGLAHGSVTASYVREGGTRVAITLASGTAGDSYSSGKWAEVDATNMKGVYQVHVPDASLATGVDAVTFTFQATGAVSPPKRVALIGQTDKPVVQDSNGRVSSDVTAVSGDSGAADNLELDYDGTGYAKANSTIGTCTTNTDMVTGTGIADEVLKRGVDNVEDTADRHSLGAMVMIGTNSSISSTTLTAKKPSDDSTFQTYTLTVSASADPITSVA